MVETSSIAAAGTNASAVPMEATAPPLEPFAVPTAFDIGWLLADLRAGPVAADRSNVAGGPPSELMVAEPPDVEVVRISAKIRLLSPQIENAGVGKENLVSIGRGLKESLEGARGGALSPQTVDGLFATISATLTAASTRMGEALGLGFDLANTCRLPRADVNNETDKDSNQNDKDSNHNEDARKAKEAERAFLGLFGARVVKVQAALADLASSLPQHAARAVALSLAQWMYWAGRPQLNKNAVAWPDPAVEAALARQGEVWRAVLAGEKRGQDMLSSDDYFTAMGQLVKNQFRKRPWCWIGSFALVLVFGAGIALVSTQPSGPKIFGGVVALLGAAGISAASLKTLAGNLARDLESQVWGAELDFAIANALTVPPGEWRVNLRKIDTPPPRGFDPHITTTARVVRKVSEASESAEGWQQRVTAWRLRKYLDKKFHFRSRDGDTIRRRHTLLLIRHPALHGFKLKHVTPGAPGRLSSVHSGDVNANGQADQHCLVWTFRESHTRWLPRQPHVRLTHVDEYANEASARQKADQPRVIDSDDPEVGPGSPGDFVDAVGVAQQKASAAPSTQGGTE